MTHVAIVIQGEFKGARTVDIIEQALHHNQRALVILSTWNSPEVEALTGKFNTQPRFKLIQSPLSTNPGDQNRHLQRYSTLIGVKEAERQAATHILKMRTDQLLRRDNVCDFLLEQLAKFGETRLIVGHGGTTLEEKWGRFHVSDHWMFGKMEHFLNWYDPTGIAVSSHWFRSHVPITSPEPDFTQVWMDKMNIRVQTFEELLGRCFIILNCEEVELITKFLPLNILQPPLVEYWEKYGDPKTIRHAAWRDMFRRSSRAP